MRQGHRPSSQFGREERSREEVASLFDAPGHEDSRKRFGCRQLEIGIVLVVPEEDVELGHALLDEVVLERERLHDRIGHDHLDRRDLVDQRFVTRAEPPCRKVAAHAVPQHARLADVDRLAGGVAPEVDAWLFGEPGDLILEVLNGHALLWRGSIPDDRTP